MWEGGGWRQGSPDELGFRVDVPHPVLGQGLVHAVEERPQKPPHHPHHDEEGQVHGGPQVTALISVRTLSSKHQNPVQTPGGTFCPPPGSWGWGGRHKHYGLFSS